ncbi:hypothetical protein [Rhodothermus profundi]|uniref:Uncharacterized protein n=1 Tax=Rhodothermus profundi TaxID=633813 RepID=A0A1M6Q8Y8_9BACT|nr:hypothetical protein [Rhodothermus profundi]SHK16661.1 hypothetical protein SAMN04488087_0513 [Rhodothermus profundi]
MGKIAILLAVAAVIGGSILLLQSSSMRLESDERQAERQEEALAREIARSAYNRIISRARRLESANPDWSLEQLVSAVNGSAGKLTGQLQGGSYEAWVYPLGASSYGAVAIGRYGEAEHRIGSHRVMRGVLEVDQPSQVKVTFLESMAGYCSAIYLQRFVPRNNNGMGNNLGGCDPSNPALGGSCSNQRDVELRGNGNGRYIALEPELVFAPGNNRDGAEALYSTVLNPGERVNFILAVDADFNCERRGDTSIDINDPFYEYTRPALLESVGDFSQMQEGMYAMIQAHPTRPNVWRIAFEDLIFPRAKLEDVKRWGYGDRRWRRRRGPQWGERNGKRSYGGWGWRETDSRGYYKLLDFGHMPDFSDQVIEIEFIPVPAS